MNEEQEAAALQQLYKAARFLQYKPPVQEQWSLEDTDYICRRCGLPGHYIKACPTNGDPAFDLVRIKRIKGVPTTLLRPVDTGTLVNSTGTPVALLPNETAFERLKTKHTQYTLPLHSLNTHFQCPLCSKLLDDAVRLPCCSAAACDPCAREWLQETGTCPLCCAPSTADSLHPDAALRALVIEHATEAARQHRAGLCERAQAERDQRDQDYHNDPLPSDDTQEEAAVGSCGEEEDDDDDDDDGFGEDVYAVTALDRHPGAS